MRSAIGVSSVRAVLEKSLLRAQKRFNLSNPQSETKAKLLKERIRERKLAKKLKHIARENRILTGTQVGEEESAEPNWADLWNNPIEIEFEPATDSYEDFVNEIKSRCIVLTPDEPFQSPQEQSPCKKKRATKKLRKLLKQQLRKDKLSAKGLVREDEESLVPAPALKKSKLEILREQRIANRKARKELKKQARKKLKEHAEEAEEKKKTKLKNKAMKDIMRITNNGTDQMNNSSQADCDVVDTSAPPCLTVTAKFALIKASNGIVKKPEPQIPKPKHVLFNRDRLILGWARKYPTGCGFNNLGNSCYMNATLQALFHIPCFVQWLLNDENHRRQCQSSQKFQQCLICAMGNTLKESQATSLGSGGIRPMQIYGKLRLISKNFVHGRQEDAHEFLRYLLESMETSYVRACGLSNLDSRSKETTPLGQIFGGYLRTEVTCLKCDHVSTTFQPLAELQLDIRHATSVEDAIFNHFRKEKVDNNDYKCEECRTISPVIKQFSLELAPYVLCLQLKRFTLFGGKLSKPVHCNRYLDLTKYLHKSLRTQGYNELKYRMVSLITHIGSSPNGGHYTAIAEAANGNMYQFDDSFVRCVSTNTALNSDAYVIIYEMVKHTDERTKSASPSVTISPSAQIREANNKIAVNGFYSRFPKPSTITSAMLDSSPEGQKSRLLSTTEPAKYRNPFVVQKTPDKKPVLSSSSFNSVKVLPKSATNSTFSSSFGASNVNAGISTNAEVKPRTERPPVSFALKNSSGQTGTVTAATPNVRTCLTPLKAALAPQQIKKSAFPLEVNGAKHNASLISSNKPHSLVPYDNEDDAEEGTPKSSRERSSSPKTNGQPLKSSKFDATLVNAPIKTWDERGSLLSKATEADRKRELEKTDEDLFNEELDAGRVKKRKFDTPKSPSRENFGNKFQNYEDQRRLVNERTKSLNLEFAKSAPRSSQSFSKDPYRSHHHHSNGDRSNVSSFYHKNNHNRDNNYFPRRGNSYNQNFRRNHSAPSYNQFQNRSHHGGGNRGGSWRSGNGSRYFNSNGNRGQGHRGYSNYYR